MKRYQIDISESLVDTVLKVVHDSVRRTLWHKQHLGPCKGILNFLLSENGYVQSCHLCQVRKISNKNSKQAIVAFPTPTKRFQVWQVGLCGPYPVLLNSNSYECLYRSGYVQQVFYMLNLLEIMMHWLSVKLSCLIYNIWNILNIHLQPRLGVH